MFESFLQASNPPLRDLPALADDANRSGTSDVAQTESEPIEEDVRMLCGPGCGTWGKRRNLCQTIKELS